MNVARLLPLSGVFRLLKPERLVFGAFFKPDWHCALVHRSFIAPELVAFPGIGRWARAQGFGVAPSRNALFCIAAAAQLVLVAPPVQAELRLTDERGSEASFDKSPRRIVSLLPSLTETVCALGACDRLVGVDRYSNHPPQVRDLPKLGGGIDPDIEGVVALKPDVVLVASSSRAAARLEALGIKVLALEPKRTGDFRRALQIIGKLLSVPNAENLWRQIDADVAAVAQSLPAHTRGASVYFEVNEGPYAAGQDSFIGEIMSRLGLHNIVPAALGAYPKLNPEFVVRADPDVILIGRRSADDLAARPGWAGLRAIRKQRVCAFDPQQADILVRAGPRMAQAARLVVDCVARQTPQAAASAR